MIIVPLATILGTVAGSAVGLVMGYFRGATDEVISRFVEAFLAIPLVVTGIVVISALGRSNLVIILVIGIVFTPLIARTVRAAVLLERELDYVSAARLRGERAPYIMFAEILPERDRADPGRVHGAARIRRVHGRDAVVPRLRDLSRPRPTGGSRSPATTARWALGSGGRCCSMRSRSRRW